LSWLGYAIAVAVEIGGSLALIAGYQTRVTAALLAAFSIVTGLAFHNHLADQNQLIHFFKNVSMAGGLLQVVAFGAGRFSLDARRR
jgi:putative oxidoreductase